MSDKVRIGNKPDAPKGPVESFADIRARKKNPEEIKSIIEALANSTDVHPSNYETVLH